MESWTSSLLAFAVQMGKAQPPRLACLRSPRCALMHIFTAFEAARWLDTGHLKAAARQSLFVAIISNQPKAILHQGSK